MQPLHNYVYSEIYFYLTNVKLIDNIINTALISFIDILIEIDTR